MQIIELDLARKHPIEGDYSIIQAKQGDVGRKFKVILTDNDHEYPVPQGAVFSVWYFGTSGEGNYSKIGQNSACVIEGNTVTVELITQMLANHGGGTLCLLMHGQDGTQIGLWNIPYAVEKVMGADGQAATQYYTALSECATMSANSARVAEEFASLAAERVAYAEQMIAGFEILSMYPVGSVYISLQANSPASLFGGAWEQLHDRFLLASGGAYTVNTTGGEANHTLTVEEMPAHHHSVGNVNVHWSDNSAVVTPPAASGSGIPNIKGARRISVDGGGQPHNNMPPYLVVNMWKRVA